VAAGSVRTRVPPGARPRGGDGSAMGLDDGGGGGAGGRRGPTCLTAPFVWPGVASGPPAFPPPSADHAAAPHSLPLRAATDPPFRTLAVKAIQAGPPMDPPTCLEEPTE